MASGHVNRANRPNTRLHRPTLLREESSCQLGAVHTRGIADPNFRGAVAMCQKQTIARRQTHAGEIRLVARLPSFREPSCKRIQAVAAGSSVSVSDMPTENMHSTEWCATAQRRVCSLLACILSSAL